MQIVSIVSHGNNLHEMSNPDILKYVFLFFQENRIRHFMQIVSMGDDGDNLHKISKPVF